jgi:uncharacterized membrane protein
VSATIHEIGPWRFGDNPDVDVIRQECELARDRKLRVSLDPAQLIELLEMIHIDHGMIVSDFDDSRSHHQLDDCDRCDELNEEIDELKEENDRLEKELAQIEDSMDGI